MYLHLAVTKIRIPLSCDLFFLICRKPIRINRELTESELTKLVAHVLKPLRESGSNYTLLANDGRTLCRITRVTDIAKIRQNLATHFSLPIDDVQLDRDEATITIELTQ